MGQIIVADPTELLVNLQNCVQGMNTLVDDCLGGDATNVVLYDDDGEGDLYNRIVGLKQPKLLIYLAGIQYSKFPARMEVLVGFAVKAKQAPKIYASILGEISEWSGSDGQPLTQSVIHPRFQPMEVPTMDRRMITFGRDGLLDYWDIQARFKDRK